MFSSRKAQHWVNNKKKEEVINKVNDNLSGPLKIENFANLKNVCLRKLRLTSFEVSHCSQLTMINLSELTQLTSLSVSDCPSLIELNCSYNSIEKLILNTCPEITKLDCSNNQLSNLKISDCLKLSSLNCSHNRLTSLDLSDCSKLEALDYSHNPPNLDIIGEKWGKEKIKNLLIVGRTGGGKSALANVLSETDEFEESARSVRKTRNFQEKEFEINGTRYRVIETDQIRGGINFSRILYVVDGVFTKEMGTFIFEKDIAEYTTIVRTNFSNFKNKGACEKDKEDLYKENETIKSCSIIYVDNPPINIIVSDEDDKEQVQNNKKRRIKSKKILLDHLKTVCQGKYYELNV